MGYKDLKIAYLLTLILFVACTAATLTAVLRPFWFNSHIIVGSIQVNTSYGLSKQCSSVERACRPFPLPGDCYQSGQLFCAGWRTASFGMMVALLFQAATLFAYSTTLLNSEYMFETGWRVITGLMTTSVVFQMLSSISMDVILETSSRFETGHWRLGASWIMATCSWVISFILVVGLVIVGLMSPPEYEFLLNEDYCDDDDDDTSDDFYRYMHQNRR